MTTLDGGVIIKKGEGGGSTPTPPSGGSTIEYLDVSGLEGVAKAHVVMIAALVGKVGSLIAPTGAILGELGIEQLVNISAIATIGDFEVATLDGVFKIRDIIDNFASIPRITKDEFYNLD